MFGWYRAQVKQHGLIDATSLFCRVGWSRSRVNLANRLLPGKVSCPCCGWSGRRFHDFIQLGYSERNTACPQCDSYARHRSFYLWLSREYRLQKRRGVALILAAEGALTPLWDEAGELTVFRMDIDSLRGSDFLGDLTKLPIAADSIDLLWCHHVLEHIGDDRAAMAELCRVLRPGHGELIVSVPMIPGDATLEYGFADPALNGHWRIYGDDFGDRLAESGFTVRAVDYRPPAADLARYGIVAEHFYICTKPESSHEHSRQ
ncbi:MAG: hypothetical protein QOD75_1842 [Blastocatellia bacterium]|jgi:SAM-dependent methyltransferase|nr:hypothetical protein [Blastocatellia bacterium]